MNAVRELADELGWRFLERGAPSDALSSQALLVVLAPQWSPLDFDILREASERLPQDVGEVQITDIDFLLSPEQYKSVLPHGPCVTQTPVVANYKNGELVELWQGADAVRRFPEG